MTREFQEAILRLNPIQREACVYLDGPELIVAGAGSGKTSVLTTRIALLIENGIPPECILALTFTRKAAEEMRQRVAYMEGDAARRVVMGTFHSVFIRFLRTWSHLVGFSPSFTILDEDDSKRKIRQCVDEVLAAHPLGHRDGEDDESFSRRVKARKEKYAEKAMATRISACKNHLVLPQAYAADVTWRERDRRGGTPLFPEIYSLYWEMYRRTQVMDFDDILVYMDILLREHPEVRAILGNAFAHILVDEYQDTNMVQYDILTMLTESNRNICVVGDDSQSIYAFRGAVIDNILNFGRDFPGHRVFKLERNYRSTQTIVDAANRLIAHNEGRIPKTCYSEGEKGAGINYVPLRDEKEEARFIASTISRSLGGRYSYRDFAILYRTNAQSRALEDALVRMRIPYVIYSGTSFFERAEVKDMMAYFKLTVNPMDDESFRRVVNNPVRGFGKAALERLSDIAMQWGVSLWEAATSPSLIMCGFKPKALSALEGFTSLISSFRDKDSSASAYGTAMHISGEVGLLAGLLTSKDPEDAARADNVRELLDSVKAFEDDCAAGGQETNPDLCGFLQNVMLLSNADTDDGNDDKVSLMTVHCAKGLEFANVFIAGMEQGLFPLEFRGDDGRNADFETEEERRLFYVAVTRAERNLVLTKADSRIRWGKRENTEDSRFLAEMLGPGYYTEE